MRAALPEHRLRASRAATPRLASLVRALTALPTRSHRTRELKVRIERALTKIIVAGGLRGVDREIATLNAHGRRLRLEARHRLGRLWHEELEGGRSLQITAITGQLVRGAGVHYEPTHKKPTRSPRRRIHALQEAFYARYMSVGQKAYTDSKYRLSPPDRLLLLIGELEADVNNGGFDQYLVNKGRRRARAALTALRTVGARKTAAMLARAMAPGASAEQLSELDTRFYRVPEDLAVLAARHVGLRPTS